ncbi:hypothetical protein [Corynebacterium bovis]|uniref:Small multidrug efflux protein n=2 Tax=Corynebacterium bovis TaxID=36808 RepID=A0A8H9YD38_9CORY|nr:hypothetical protein [Corynebacterium bovis]MBB3116756.1 hypothetical protein [Corynebacterium bovis DSM 20582 = CIP 54.80]QQC46715.1 hypothetical protein I6I09_06120 [Corynebacterium bovis]RRO91053.1 hypothetical protein CXF45_04720 [Corynebacterium bovis]RRQ15320.1 hypothetical protein CXF46_08825 [Corynebacterium bovis]WJY78366.1 hypothetical protein CBOVI_09395 [Corynebacterium bovis DSM 20582 = CIP 54.80]
MIGHALESLQSWVHGLPVVLQVLAVFVIGVVPVLEGDVAAAVGIVAGVSWPATFLAGTAGTVLATVGGVALGGRVDGGLRARRRRRDRERLPAAADGTAAPTGQDPGPVRTPDGTALPVGGRGRDRSREERRRALLDRVARWGLPAAMILGGVVSPVAINAFLLASAGMNRRALRLWGVVSAVVNTALAVAATTGLLHLIWR